MVINLYGNRLTALPDGVSAWSVATVIDLRVNRLTSLPETVSGWSAATWIILNGNQLTALPDGVSGWSAATHINLGNNQLTALPDAVAGLSVATHINLDNNQLTSLPETVAGWSAVTHIYLNGNSILFVDDHLCAKCSGEYDKIDKYFSLQNKRKIQERYARKIQKIYRQHQERRKAAAVVIQRLYKDYFYRVEGPWYTKVKGNYLKFQTL